MKNSIVKVVSCLTFNFKHHDKCKLTVKLIPLVTTFNLFPLQVEQKCQHCQLCVLWENSNLALFCEKIGRVVNVTSVKGRLPVLFSAAYAITKYGGESFSDILRLEMSKFGVSVSIVEPCSFGMATDCLVSQIQSKEALLYNIYLYVAH